MILKQYLLYIKEISYKWAKNIDTEWKVYDFILIELFLLYIIGSDMIILKPTL